MAYFLTYVVQYTNKITETNRIELYRKDVEPDSVIELQGTYCTKKILNGGDDGSEPILSSELAFGIFIKSDNVSFENFITSFYDEWKVVFKVDDQIHFTGFITPGESECSFLSKPYEIDISCTDGLGLLKNVSLVKIDGSEFRSIDRIIDYIAAALYQSNLNLNIRLYANIYESSFQTRNDNNSSDVFNNAKLDYRTFQSDSTSFDNCYDVLTSILSEGYRLFQWMGKWLILRIGEMQNAEGPKLWFTEYDYQANVVKAAQDLNTAALIQAQQIIHHIQASQKISSNFAVKSAKHTFEYKVWPEIPKNNKFDRGTLIPLLSNSTGSAYTIDDWIFGRSNPGSPSTYPPTMLSTTDNAYRFSTINIYGVETDHEIILENGSDAGHRILMCDPVPVKKGDKGTINLDFKFFPSGTGTKNFAYVFIQPDAGGTKWTLDIDLTVADAPYKWVLTSGLTFLSKFYSGTNWGDYSTIPIDMPEYPATGKLYICFLNYDSTNTRAYFKNFSFEYFPYIAGGYKQVKADYWLTEQSINYKDVISESVAISDSEIKVLKGALYRSNGIDLTTRSWSRLNVTESRDYKEILNLGRYNQHYRRMWIIRGTFGGDTFHPESNQTIVEPLGFHRHFKFSDPGLASKLFELVPPLTINYDDGSFEGIFREVYEPGQNDGNQLGNTHIFNYSFT